MASKYPPGENSKFVGGFSPIGSSALPPNPPTYEQAMASSSSSQMPQVASYNYGHPMPPASNYGGTQPPGAVGGSSIVVNVPVEAAQFDAGARFSAQNPPTIPPPPPGCLPNSAQIQSMETKMTGQPNQVPVSKKKSNIWKGTGSGGVTFW